MCRHLVGPFQHSSNFNLASSHSHSHSKHLCNIIFTVEYQIIFNSYQKKFEIIIIILNTIVNCFDEDIGHRYCLIIFLAYYIILLYRHLNIKYILFVCMPTDMIVLYIGTNILFIIIIGIEQLI